MDVIILAAGYATRLYPLTLNQPKPLLSVRGRPILDYIVDKVDVLPSVADICIVTNERFYGHFVKWQQERKAAHKIHIINDGTKDEKDRLGAIKDIHFVRTAAHLKKDLLVIAGDNLFDDSLADLVQVGLRESECLVGVYQLPDRSLAKQYGLVTLDEHDRICEFVEKGEEAFSSTVATCIYFFPRRYLCLLDEYVHIQKELDAPGNFIRWLVSREIVKAYHLRGKWHDIGSKKSYEEVNSPA